MPEKAAPEEQRTTADHRAGDQTAVLHFLGDPASYGHGVDKVERIDTHGAIVFLAGELAYKVKRAVAYPYMDFSTLEKRRRFCLRERDINRRTAPDLYLDVLPLTQSDQGFKLGGEGAAVEWVLVMRRFDQACLFDRLAEVGELTPEMMTALADAIARFHEAAEPHRNRDAGAKAMTWVVRENGEEFAEREDLFDRRETQSLTESSCTAWRTGGAAR